MSNGKLKITCGDLNLELEGDNELLYRSFTDLRIDGSISNNISSVKSNVKTILESSKAETKISENDSETKEIPLTVVASNTNDSELPDFNSLILEKRTFSTSNWMLFMAWSVSHKGKIKFTKKQLRKIYSGSCKHIGLRSKDFVSNFMLLLINDYIIMIDKNTYELSETGYNQVHATLAEPNETNFFSEAI